MRTQVLDLKAGKPQYYALSGGYFELLQASQPVTVTFEANIAQQVDNLELVTEGIYVNQQFTGFTIVSATDQTVKLLHGAQAGGNRAAPLTGSVAVTNTGANPVPVTGPLTSAQLNAAVVVTRERREERGIASRAYVTGSNINAAATTGYRVGIYNPVGSGRLVTVDRALIELANSAGATDWSISKVFGYSAVPGAGVNIVTKGAGSATAGNQSAARAISGAAAALDTGFTGASQLPLDRPKSQAALARRDLRGVVLAEGEALVLWVMNGAAVQDIALGIDWSEE